MEEQERAALESFARHQLGCNCPDSVFADIRRFQPEGEMAALPLESVIAYGGRLLVLVCRANAGADLQTGLAALVDAGRQLRDDQGFNRMRLVAVEEDIETTSAALAPLFEQSAAGDEKLHLHVIKPQTLP